MNMDNFKEKKSYVYSEKLISGNNFTVFKILNKTMASIHQQNENTYKEGSR